MLRAVIEPCTSGGAEGVGPPNTSTRGASLRLALFDHTFSACSAASGCHVATGCSLSPHSILRGECLTPILGPARAAFKPARSTPEHAESPPEAPRPVVHAFPSRSRAAARKAGRGPAHSGTQA